MSLGSRKGTFDDAIKASMKAGVTYVVAAGNLKGDACNGSPGGISGIITVGSIAVDSNEDTQIDIRATQSNYGTCVTVFAPGELIESVWIGSTTATKVLSGTSMSCPFVTGMVAVYMGEHGIKTPAQVKSWLESEATTNMIDLSCDGVSLPSVCLQSPNRIAYLHC